MAQVQIPNLPAVASVGGADLLEIVQAGVSSRASITQVANYVESQIGTGVTAIGFGTTGLTPAALTGGAITVSGTLVASHGGTGFASYTVGDVLYADTTTTLAKLGIGSANLPLVSNGTNPGYAVLTVTGGGTGQTTFTSHGVLLGNGASGINVTAVGTTGTFFGGNTGADPTFQSLSGFAVTTISFGTTGLTPNSATNGAVTVAGTLVAANGGTGFASYTVGDLIYASGTTALSKLVDVATGAILVSGGVGVAPAWSTTPSISGTLTVIGNTFLGGASGSESLRVTTIASAVNRWQINGNTTNNAIELRATGGDANLTAYLGLKGTGSWNFFTDYEGVGPRQFQINHTDSATRWITVTGSNGGNPVIGSSAGNVDVAPSGTVGISMRQNSIGVAVNTAIPAGGSNTSGVLVSSTASFGFFFGSGAPTLSAAQGSLYLRSDGKPSYNTNGTTGWATMPGLEVVNTWSALQTYNAGINLSGASSPLQVGGSAGTSGQPLISAGAGATPTYGTLSVAGGGTGVGTLTGIVKGNGTSAFSAATAGTDYVAPTVATNFTANQTFTGATTTFGAKFYAALENAPTAATVATGTINYDTVTKTVLYYTSNASGNWTLNVRGDASHTLDSLMATGEALTLVFAVTQGGTAFYNSAVTIDGNAVTPKWQGGTAPSAGNINSVDIYSYTIFKTGSATFTVFAVQSQFA